MAYYKADEIYPWLYRISEPLNVCFYLIIGNDKALLFDTGHGLGDINETLKAITSKPVIVVLGHGHVDHSCGAYQFDEVLLNENDFELCHEHTSPSFRKETIDSLANNGIDPNEFDTGAYCKAGTGNLKKLETDTVFDLGGLSVKVIGMPGHTKGSVGLLILEKQILLDSDSANEHIWMFLDESTGIKQYIEMLKRVSELDFHTFFTAHSDIPHPKSDFQNYIKVAEEAAIEKAVRCEIFPELESYVYKNHNAVIVFNSSTLNKE